MLPVNSPAFTYSSLASNDEANQLGRILGQCFISPPSDSEKYFDRIGQENFRVLRANDSIAGGLALLPMGQWWGGRRVPMTGIASVGIAPEYRGSGAAIAMMQHTITELYEQKVPLSVLYAAAQQLYRRAGYEQAGLTCGWEIDPEVIAMRNRPLTIHSIPLDADLLTKLYSQQAPVNSGNLDRHSAIWKEILTADDQPIYAYSFGNEGYAIVTQQRSNGSARLRILDWVLLTPAAGRTFWSFLADHRSMIDLVQWKSSAIDPLTLLLPEQNFKPRFIERWMLRIVDAAAALEMRGYPDHVAAELHLDLQDDLIAANCGRFCLTVAEGRAQVTRGGSGALKLDIRGLAPLYTNLFTPMQLRAAGWLEGDDRTLTTAGQLFSGASPWMLDFF